MLTGSGRDLAAFEANSARLRAVRGGNGMADRLVAYSLRGDTAAISRALATMAASRPTMNLAWPRVPAMWLGEFDIAERGARSQTDQNNTRVVRRRGHLNLARLLTGLGRWSEAETNLDLMRELDPVGARAERALLATLPWLEVPTSSLEAARAELVEWQPEAPVPGTPLDRAYELHRRAYYLALVHSKMGDAETALAYADTLESLPDESGIPAVVQGLAATVRANIAWRAGRSPDEILALLEPVQGNVPAFLWRMDPMVSQEHARLLRVIALHASGEETEALRWLEHGFKNTPGWDYYQAPVHYLRAVVHEAGGRPDEAAAALASFGRLWSEADSQISIAPER